MRSTISLPVSIPQTFALSHDVSLVFPVGDKEVDSSQSQTLSKRITIIHLVTNHWLGPLFWSSDLFLVDSDVPHNLFKERDLSRRRLPYFARN
jgi:hypothetical protein